MKKAIIILSILLVVAIGLNIWQRFGKLDTTKEDVKIESNNLKIDSVLFSPNLESENSNLRKPNTGMADKAKNQFPEIDFSKSIMVGDSLSDMEFGKRKRMKTVFINKGLNPDFDRNFSSLKDFTKSVS